MAKFNQYGSVDTSFGTRRTISSDDSGLILEIQLNGQIVEGICGAGGHFVLARFNGDGSRDTSFASGGVEVGASERGGLAMVTAANGESVIIGKRSSGESTRGGSSYSVVPSSVPFPSRMIKLRDVRRSRRPNKSARSHICKYILNNEIQPNFRPYLFVPQIQNEKTRVSDRRRPQLQCWQAVAGLPRRAECAHNSAWGTNCRRDGLPP